MLIEWGHFLLWGKVCDFYRALPDVLCWAQTTGELGWVSKLWVRLCIHKMYIYLNVLVISGIIQLFYLVLSLLELHLNISFMLLMPLVPSMFAKLNT